MHHFVVIFGRRFSTLLFRGLTEEDIFRVPFLWRRIIFEDVWSLTTRGFRLAKSVSNFSIVRFFAGFFLCFQDGVSRSLF
jgi:hypothetical protein